MARACIQTKGMCGGPFKHIHIPSLGKPVRAPRMDAAYRDPGQRPPTDLNPVDQRKQFDMGTPGKLKGAGKALRAKRAR